MFESVVVDVLNRFLGDYVVNLDTSQLTLGIWGGNETAAAAPSISFSSRPLVFGASGPSLARHHHLPPPSSGLNYVKPGGGSRASARKLFVFWQEGVGVGVRAVTSPFSEPGG